MSEIYENYQIPEKDLRLIQKLKAIQLTTKYIEENNAIPPANVKNSFMDISEEEYKKYQKRIFASQFVKDIDPEESIVNLPDDRSKTRYNEFVQCVYNVTDKTDKTQIFNNKVKPIVDNIGYLEIDGQEVEIEDVIDGYQFETLGTHNVDFLLKNPTSFMVNFRDCQNLREITIPSIVNQLGDVNTKPRLATFFCNGIYSIRFLSEFPPASVDFNVFYGIKSNGTLIVPKNCTSNYSSWIGKTYQAEVLTSYSTTALNGWQIVEMDE